MKTCLQVMAIVFLLGVLSDTPRAEVSVGGVNGQGGFFSAGGGDGAEPWPWNAFRVHAPWALFLNPLGDLRGDGPAAFAIDPGTGLPEVAWAWFDGNDREIVLSRWDGQAWSAPEQVTDNAVDDLDPALAFTDAGALRLSWWRPGVPPQVWFTERPPGSFWADEERVTWVVAGGSRPAAEGRGAVQRVAYQSEEAGIRSVVAAWRGPAWEQATIHQTAYQGPRGDGDIDVEIHRFGGRLWVDWVEAAGVLGFASWNPQTESWSAMQTEPYSWDQAAGLREEWARAMARVRVRARITRN